MECPNCKEPMIFVNTDEHNALIGHYYCAGECKKEAEKRSTIDMIKHLLKTLTDDERMEIFDGYCKHCGCNDRGCQCWNDD